MNTESSTTLFPNFHHYISDILNEWLCCLMSIFLHDMVSSYSLLMRLKDLMIEQLTWLGQIVINCESRPWS
jgi:hypothetical protein